MRTLLDVFASVPGFLADHPLAVVAIAVPAAVAFGIAVYHICAKGH